jgi:hypothetical protein
MMALNTFPSLHITELYKFEMVRRPWNFISNLQLIIALLESVTVDLWPIIVPPGFNFCSRA